MPFTAGQRLTAGALNHAVGGPVRRLTQSPIQNFASSTGFSLLTNWVPNVGDEGNASGITLSAGKLTVSEAGLYIASAGVRWASNATGRRILGIIVNGTAESIFSIGAADAANFANGVFNILKLAVNDVVEVGAGQSSGVALDTNIASNGTRFELAKLTGS